MGRRKKNFVVDAYIKIIDGVPYNVYIERDKNGNVRHTLSKNVAGQYIIKGPSKNSMAGVVEGYKEAMCRLFEGAKNQGDVSRLIQQSVHHTERVKLFLRKANANFTEEDYKKVLLGAIYEGIQTLKDKNANLSDAELFEILSTVANDELKLKNSITYDIIKNNLLNENEDELE